MKATQTIAATQKPPRKSLWASISKHYELYLFLLPMVVWYGIFSYGPMYGVQIAFKDFNGALGIWGSRWVGLRHLRSFINGYYFWPLIRNTVYLSLYSLIAGAPLSVLLALMLNELKFYKYRKVIQTITYAPHFISLVVLIGMVNIVMSPSVGIVNRLLVMLGMESQYFMISPTAFRHIYVWSGIWQNTGWATIIYLAALSGVDPSLHEAAVIDGASRFQRVRYINIPSITPTFTILLIMSTGSIMSVGFEKAFLLQNSLNTETSNIIATYVYQRGLINADFSFSTAVGLFNNVVNCLLILLVNFIAGKIGETSLF